MSLIVTYNTDQYKVKYGYCTHCNNYNEVWRNEKKSKCSYCGKQMAHISGKIIYGVFYVLFLSFMIFYFSTL